MRLAFLAVLALAAPARADDGTVQSFIVTHQPQLDACSPKTQVKLTLSIRWVKDGRITSLVLRGGSARVRRCATKVLRDEPVDDLARGHGRARFTLGGPHATLSACTTDSECTLHFQTSACIEEDPVAVRADADPTAVAAKYPVKRLDCGMGGPQYDKLREENDGRYAAVCMASHCAVHDNGPRKVTIP